MNLLVLMACSGAKESAPTQIEPESAFFEYYLGESLTTSPDGTRTYAENSVLVRRHVDPSGQQIVENTWYDQDARTTTMTRQGETDVFDASDDQGSFTGTLSYTGPVWHYTAWTYAISMTDGSGSLTGTGTLSDGVWASTKTYSNAQNEAEALITDTLQVIDEATFPAELPSHEP